MWCPFQGSNINNGFDLSLHRSRGWRPWPAGRSRGAAGTWPSPPLIWGQPAPAPETDRTPWSDPSGGERIYSSSGWASAGTRPGPSYRPAPAACSAEHRNGSETCVSASEEEKHQRLPWRNCFRDSWAERLSAACFCCTGRTSRTAPPIRGNTRLYLTNYLATITTSAIAHWTHYHLKVWGFIQIN